MKGLVRRTRRRLFPIAGGTAAALAATAALPGTAVAQEAETCPGFLRKSDLSLGEWGPFAALALVGGGAAAAALGKHQEAQGDAAAAEGAVDGSPAADEDSAAKA